MIELEPASSCMEYLEKEPSGSARSRRLAVELARSATEMLNALGVSVRVVGSLAKGRYSQGSDIDFLVECCPRQLKYAIEGRVEDCLRGHPFDVIYLDEVPEGRRRRFLEGAIHARYLR